MRERGEPQKFYRWVGVHEKELDGLAPKQVDAKFGEEARKGNWFSTEPLTHTQATMDMGIRPEWPQDKVLRCYEYEPPSGTESYEGAARRQPYGDTGDGTRARSDLVGGGTQAYIPNDGTRDDWKIRRVDLDMPAGSTRTDSPVRAPVERFGVESRNPFDEISEKNREKDVHDPSRIENCYSGPIEKYVQP